MRKLQKHTDSNSCCYHPTRQRNASVCLSFSC